MPKVTSSPSISEEQRERILRSKKLAEERRLAKLKNKTVHNSNITYTPCKGNGATLLEKISENENEPNTLNTDNENASSQNEIVEITSFQKEDTPARVSNVNEINKLNIMDTENVFSIEENDVGKAKKKVRENVIDSSDEDDNVVVMNESIRVDVHTNFDEKDDDGNDHTIMKHGLRNDKHNIDDDVIEMDDNSKDDQENNHLNNCQETDNYINNQHEEKCNNYQENDILDQKDGSKNVDGHKNHQSEIDFSKDSVTDTNNCNNLDDNDKEIEPELILSKINTNSVSPKNDSDVEADKKSPKASSLQESESIKDSVEGKRQVSTNVTEKEVVDNVEELMDVDFDDEF